MLGGFPKSGLDAYVGKLVRAGHSVAVAFQDATATYWSSTTNAGLPLDGWHVALGGGGGVSSAGKGFGYHVLPVRSGQ